MTSSYAPHTNNAGQGQYNTTQASTLCKFQDGNTYAVPDDAYCRAHNGTPVPSGGGASGGGAPPPASGSGDTTHDPVTNSGPPGPGQVWCIYGDKHPDVTTEAECKRRGGTPHTGTGPVTWGESLFGSPLAGIAGLLDNLGNPALWKGLGLLLAAGALAVIGIILWTKQGGNTVKLAGKAALV